jgi:hypothetical protein
MLIMRQVSKPITAMVLLLDVIVLLPPFEVIPECPDLWMGSPQRVSPERSHNEMRRTIQVKKENFPAGGLRIFPSTFTKRYNII